MESTGTSEEKFKRHRRSSKKGYSKEDADIDNTIQEKANHALDGEIIEQR